MGVSAARLKRSFSRCVRTPDVLAILSNLISADTRTEWQVHSMHVLILTLLRDYPGCRVCGHRDLSPDLNGNGEIEPEEWIKACPCFEVKKEWN